jgi:hypothetical protein
MRFCTYAQNLLSNGAALDIWEIEKEFRAAALRDGDAAFRHFLSSINIEEPCCPVCNTPLSKIDKRKKVIVSLMGTGVYERGYYECLNGHGHFIPCDDLVGVHGTAYTPGVRFAVSKLASAGAFEWTSGVLAEIAEIYVSPKECQRISESAGEKIEQQNKERINAAMIPEPPRSDFSECVPITQNDQRQNDQTLYVEFDGTGIPMTRRELVGRAGKQADGSAKTREAKIGCLFTQVALNDKGDPIRDTNSTSYVGAIETAEMFGWRIYAEAQRRDERAFKRTVIIGDGAKWVWGIAERHFPNAIHIVDMYHAIEHLCELARELSLDPGKKDSMLDDWVAALKSGNIELLAEKILSLPHLSDKQKEKARTQANYFLENAERMRYAKFKKIGLFVGSGVIEAGCKVVVGQRLKQSGMFWNVHGANTIIALRCADLSCNEDFASSFSTVLPPLKLTA